MMKKRLGVTEMSFYRRMLRIPRTENVTKEEILSAIGTKKALVFRIRKKS